LIQVLQEVAAARGVLMMCGSTEIDGHAFCVALESRSPDLLSEAPLGLQRLILTVTYLIKGAVFRRKKVSRSSGRFSLRIRSLGELIDMCHTHEATERHDKVFALLGMSSDDPGATGILPNYQIPWRELLQQVIKFILGGEASVKTWAETEMAVIEGKGLILGKVSSEGNTDSNNRQQVLIAVNVGWAIGYSCTNKAVVNIFLMIYLFSIPCLVRVESKTSIARANRGKGHVLDHVTIQQLKMHADIWRLSPRTLVSAKSIQAGDLICLLRGASKPTIIRSCKGHFFVVAIAVPLDSIATESEPWHDLLLVWDWEKLHVDMQDREYETVLRYREVDHPVRECRPDKLARLWSTALILKDVKKYKKAE
jgi:hypothetical protein